MAYVNVQQELADALDELWPSIGPWCIKHGIQEWQLLSGRRGLPFDGDKMRKLRGAKRLTAGQLAARVDVSRDMIQKIGTGSRHPSVVLFAKIAKVLDCPPVYLLPDSSSQLHDELTDAQVPFRPAR